MKAPRPPRALLVLLMLMLALAPRLTPRSAAEAATLTFAVTTTADAPDAQPGDGVCAALDGQCTLRAAVQEANAQPSGSTITVSVPSGTYALSLGALALISNTIVISGAGPRTTVLDAQAHSQVVTVGSKARAALVGVTLVRGTAGGGNGGGIANAGTLVLRYSALSGNVAGYGGGLYNGPSARLWVLGSTILSNTATADSAGGGIFNGGTRTLSSTAILSNTTSNSNGFNGSGGGIFNGGTMTLSSTAILSNTTTGSGGGIDNSGGTLTLTNSTLSGNIAPPGQGGGIYNAMAAFGFAATTTLAYVTVAANSDGLVNAAGSPAGTVALTGTIVANSTSGPNCTGVMTEGQGYNLDSGASCGFAQPTDRSSANPLLGPLAFNGGPTPTLALLVGSPAIDHGGSSANGCPATDQRGVARPQGAACDIGAYELTP